MRTCSCKAVKEYKLPDVALNELRQSMVGIPALIEWVQLASTRLLLLLLGVSIHRLRETRRIGGSASRFENRKHSTGCTCMFGHTSLKRTAMDESTNLDEVEFTLQPQIYLGPGSKHGT